ncbi:M56 family metallopeptidase [Cohnella hongkongensis]|uniref:M56 family metallopeptidase n=1 Tax=Cohnella hongkongensis TaxID=178337 RepID=A0ABV9F6P8_9BACL
MELAARLLERVLIGSAEAAVLVLLILALRKVCRKALSPAWSYALWFLLLAKLVIPLLPEEAGSQLRWMAWPGGIEARWPDGGTVEPRVLPEPGAVVSKASERTEGAASPAPAAGPRGADLAPTGAVVQAAAAVWLAGVAAVALALLAGHLRMSRALRREAVPAAPPELERLFAQLRGSLGIGSRVGLRLTRLVSGPVLFGVRSPVVLIPADLIGRLDPVEWECVLRHELAHLKRNDIPANLIACLAASVHWFNPLVWYGLRRMRADQESACDANVLRVSGLRDAYASCVIKLLEIGVARKAALSGVGFFGNKKRIARRIVMIRDYKPARKKAPYIGAAIFILAGALALPPAFAADKPEPQSRPASSGVESQDEAGAELRLQLPEGAKISSRYGVRVHPSTSERTLHDGIDIAGQAGTELFAAAAGKVVVAEYVKAKGLTVIIEHNDEWSTEYRHLDELSVEAGDTVKSGDPIGRMGSTGDSTGPHLHYSVLKNGEYVDPLSVTTIEAALK